MPVYSPDKVCQVFNCLIEGPVWSFIEPVTFGIVNYKTVEMPPVVIKEFDKIAQLMPVAQKDRRFLKDMRNNIAFIFFKQCECPDKIIDTLGGYTAAVENTEKRGVGLFKLPKRVFKNNPELCTLEQFLRNLAHSLSVVQYRLIPYNP